MKKDIILFGKSNIVNISDIVEIEEVKVRFKNRKSKKNPDPKPSGFWGKLAYSEIIYYDEEKEFTCVILKIKGGTQLRGKVDDNGNFSGYNNQLYDFYTIYNDKSIIEYLEDNKENTLKIGNFYSYPSILNYSEYEKTNMLFDESVHSKEDFIKKYL